MRDIVTWENCPRCGNQKFREWSELDEDQKFMVERFFAREGTLTEQRGNRRYCSRCLWEQVTDGRVNYG